MENDTLGQNRPSTRSTYYQKSLTSNQTVNSKAETVLNAVAIAFLVLGAIASVFVLVEYTFLAQYEEMMILAGIIAAPIVFFFMGLLPWACIKIIINMSRNLHAIRIELEDLRTHITNN